MERDLFSIQQVVFAKVAGVLISKIFSPSSELAEKSEGFKGLNEQRGKFM